MKTKKAVAKIKKSSYKKKRGKSMIKKLLQVLKIRQKDKRELEDRQARQKTYKQIQEARKYI